MTPVIVGVDPGGAWCGIVVRRGADAVWVDAVHRGDEVGDAGWLAHVRASLNAAMAQAASLDAALAEAAGLRQGKGLLAVEDVVAPNPHVRVTNVAALLGTAKVVGMVLAVHPTAILVRPGGHGSAPLASYPPNLVGDRERAGSGRLKHARSAYDVAGAGLAHWRMAYRYTDVHAKGGRL
jgi:hypothetical protein